MSLGAKEEVRGTHFCCGTKWADFRSVDCEVGSEWRGFGSAGGAKVVA